MRRIDKKLNMIKANLLAESRYLESKGLLTEDISGPQKTDQDIEELAYDIVKKTEHLIPDMKAVYDAQKKLINDTAKGNIETRDRLVDAVGVLTSRIKSRLIGLSEEELVNEIGPEMAAKALSYNNDPRKKQILIDATNSLFSKYTDNKEYNFSFQGGADGQPAKYVLSKVVTNHKFSESTVDFYFYNENGVESDAPYINNKKEIVLTYHLKYDTITDKNNSNPEITNISQLTNATTAVFLTKAANWIRNIYFKVNPPKINIDGKMVNDPDFNINSKIKKQNFKMFSA